MNYVKSFDLFGVPAMQIASITGSGAPTTATEGAVGCLYMDIDSDTGNLYKCTAVADGVYTWVQVESEGTVKTVNGEPTEDDIPKVFITGVKPTTKDDVYAEMQYISKTDNFHAYLKIKCQGTSSMSYAKKNFTIKMYSDESRETKLKKSFKDWNYNGNKYVLKANYIDHSHARNIVSARLWGEVVASRPDYDSLPVEMRNAPNNGAVDGFPIKVYYNGNYEGVYTWNIGKDDWMWGMDEDNANHVLMCAEGNTDGVYKETASNFRALWDGVDGSKPGWSVEVGTNSTAVKTSLNNLIQFVMDNDGDSFRNGIGQYLDIRSAIDYYIFQYDICGLDGLAHNMLLATYDGKVWRCGAYDLDATFGLWWDGSKFVSATYACPEDYQEQFSLLWERIESNFGGALKERQAELRNTVLSYSNIVTHFERFMDVIGIDLYAEDLTIYSAIPSGSTNNIKQIRDYIRDRQAYVDAEFAAMDGSESELPELPEPADVPCTGVTLSASTLTFTAEGTQTLTATVTPDGCTDIVRWVSSNDSVATVSGGVVTATGNGDAVITVTCGKYSASCSVIVSGIEPPLEVDYTLDAFASATWLANTNVSKTTGELIADATGEYAIEEQCELQPGALYSFANASGGTYPGIAIFDPNNTFAFYEEGSTATGRKFAFSEGYTARAKLYAGTASITPSKLAFKPATNQTSATTYSKVTLQDMEWTLNNRGAYECDITSVYPTALASVHINCAMLSIGSVTSLDSCIFNSSKLFNILLYNGIYYLSAYGFESEDDFNAYLVENNPTIEFNIHAK